MKIVSGPRQSGKTELLIKEATAHHDSVIICAHQIGANAINDKVGYKLAYTTQSTSAQYDIRMSNHVYIDNLELVLHNLFGGGLIAATTSSDIEDLLKLNQSEVTY